MIELSLVTLSCVDCALLFSLSRTPAGDRKRAVHFPPPLEVQQLSGEKKSTRLLIKDYQCKKYLCNFNISSYFASFSLQIGLGPSHSFSMRIATFKWRKWMLYMCHVRGHKSVHAPYFFSFSKGQAVNCAKCCIYQNFHVI